MKNSVMTGTIILSAEDSAQIRQKILNPSSEYIQERQEYFDRLASGMIIHSEGTNSTVEFEDLDLSDLDAMFEEEHTVPTTKPLKKNTEYVSTTSKASYVDVHQRMGTILEAMYSRISFDVPNTKYDCARTTEQAVIQGCNLTEAA